MNTHFFRLGGKSRLVAAAVALSVGLSASAAETFPNGGTLEPNVEYTFGNVELSATFVPSTTGEIMYNCVGFMSAYSDSDHTIRIEQSSSSFINGKQFYTINVTKELPIYFFAGADDIKLMSNPGDTFTIVENQPIEIISYSTEPGSTLSLTSGFDDLLINFNQGVKATSTVIFCTRTGASMNIPMSSVPSTSLAVNYVSTIKSMLDNGSIEAGDELVLTISGITNSGGSSFNNGNDLILKYKTPSKPVSLLSARVPDPFLAYWKDGDSDAVMTAEYSGNISKAQYLLTYGNFESEVPDGYIEEGFSDDSESISPIIIDGNKVTINFAGVQRTPQDMVPSGMDYGVINLTLIAWDESGEPVIGQGQGSVGSAQYELQYLYVSPAKFNVTFTPESGQSLKGVDNIYVHLYDYEKIQYTGVKFEVENAETYTVEKSEITETGGSDFDWTLTIPVPAAVQNTNSKVTVTFDNAQFLDRDDHAEEFTAIYFGGSAGLNDDFYVLPEEGSVDRVYDFEVGCENFAVGLSENVDLNITLTSMSDREILHTFTMNDCKVISTPKAGIEIPSDASENDSRYYDVVVKFSLPSPIVDEGVYTLIIPEGFFTFSQVGSTTVTLNSVKAVSYEILNEETPIEFTAIPAPGNIKELKEVSVYFPQGPGIGEGYPQLIIDNGSPITLQAEPEYPSDFSDLSMTLKITMPTTYKAVGTYTIVFPDRYLLDVNGNSIGDVRITYYIGETGIEELTMTSNRNEIYSLDGRQIKNDSKLERGIYIINGLKVIIR